MIFQEFTVNEKLDLKKGTYTGTNITPTKLQLDRMKRRGDVPKDYVLPSQGGQPKKVTKKDIKKVTKKEVPPMDIMGAGTKNKDLDSLIKKSKVRATAANTKDFDKTLALQKSLIAKGAKIDADGIMGPKTRAAMKKFMTPPPVPKMRPKTLPKSGGPDPRFITGPELDMPKKREPFLAAPPERMNRISKNNQINSPGALGGKVKPITTPGPNTYRADAQGNYKKISPDPAQPKPGDSLVTRIGQGFNKMGRDLKGIGKNIYNFADKYGIASNLNRFAQKNQNKNKMASKESAQPKKTMIEQITGKKTCL